MYRLLIPAITLLPLVSFAAQPTDFKSFVDVILGINQLLVLSIFALTFLVLAWAIINTWIIHGGDEQEIEKGKKIVLAGIIGLVVMSGIWGILAMLRAGFFGF